MKKKYALIFLILISIIVGVVIIGCQYYVKEADSIVIEDVEFANLEDGTYLGSYDFGIVKATVQIEILQHEIHNIQLIEHENGLGSKAEDILKDIKEQNRIDVDTISGATISSKVIQQATVDALNK